MISLTQEESALIVDALNGIMIQPEILAESVLWQKIEEAIAADHLDAKWKVDGVALVEKLKAASHDDATRIVELAQKFWEEQASAQSIFGRVREIGMANAVAANDALITATEAAKVSGKSVQHLSQLAARRKIAVYPDLTVKNPRKRNRYVKSEIVALRKKKAGK